MGTILIVEDDCNTRNGLAEILTEEGYEVKLANDAASALQRLTSKIDLILLDLRLPDMSGIDLLEKVKSVKPKIRTIIMTAYSTPEYYEKASKMGILSWLTKPLDIEQLLLLLRRAISTKLVKQKSLQS